GADADPGDDPGLRAQDHRHLHHHAGGAAVHGRDHGHLYGTHRRDDRDRRMISLNWLPETAYLYLLIFARVGTILMLMPALGEQIIPARMRLSFALLFTLVLFPLLSPSLPRLPGDMLEVIVLLLHELLVGFVFGVIMRLLVSSTQVAGSVIAFQLGLSVAQSADPTNGGIQGAIIGSFVSFLGIALIFATDLHHVALAAVYDSYMIFSPTDPLMFGDAAEMVVQTVA